ncbi:MAG: sugar phosphate isomerase/epimerase [Clostridia bacterium]|nr:sugar phosphate isomerase/epimerase [Clostridia bacterium]
MIEYGLQLYSVRDITKDNLRDALRAVAEMGYKYVEFAGFFDNSAEDVKAWLDEYGLIASGTHTKLDALTDDAIEATIAYHKTIGCKNLIVPSAKWKTEEQMEENIAALNKAQKTLAAAGITLGYHNHSGEFYETPYGKIVEDELLARTDIAIQIDTFWLFNAGIDPVPYLEAHKDHISVIHLKDGIVSKDTKGSFADARNGAEGKSVGAGDAPVEAVRAWAIANNVLMVIESEGLDPTGPEEVKRCIDFLRSLEA